MLRHFTDKVTEMSHGELKGGISCLSFGRVLSGKPLKITSKYLFWHVYNLHPPLLSQTKYIYTSFSTTPNLELCFLSSDFLKKKIAHLADSIKFILFGDFNMDKTRKTKSLLHLWFLRAQQSPSYHVKEVWVKPDNSYRWMPSQTQQL